MAGMALVALHQLGRALARRQGGSWKGGAGYTSHPVFEGPYVNIGAGGQVALALGPFLPMEENLVVFQHDMVAQVLQPLGSGPQQQARQQGAELEWEAGKQATFARPNGSGIHHGEKAGEPLGREVVPHQSRGDKGGELAAQFSPAWTLRPGDAEARRIGGCELGLHRCGVLALTHRAVVGEGHMAHIEHVLQQGEGIHRQVPEGVLHQPEGVIQQGHPRQVSQIGLLALAGENKQQALGRGSGMGAAGTAGIAAGAGGGLRFRLGNGGAMAFAVKTPTVVGALQLTPFVDAALAKGHLAVGADVGEGAPLARPGVPPQNEILAKQGERGGSQRV